MLTLGGYSNITVSRTFNSGMVCIWYSRKHLIYQSLSETVMQLHFAFRFLKFFRDAMEV